MSKERLAIYEYITSPSATSPTQGDIVYEKIEPIIKNCIKNKNKFSIDFTGIKILTTAFLNNSIGKLFYEFDSDDILSLMTFTGLSNTTQVKTLRLTLSNSLALSQSKSSKQTQQNYQI